MVKKKASSSSKLAQFIERQSRARLVTMGIIFVVIVGGGGTYLTSSSLAATPCINQSAIGVGNGGTCVAIAQRAVRNFGSWQSAKSSYFKYSTRTTLMAGSFVDGKFGTNTYNQVRNYQRWQGGLSTDGVVGRQTWTSLCNQQFAYGVSRADHVTACGR